MGKKEDLELELEREKKETKRRESETNMFIIGILLGAAFYVFFKENNGYEWGFLDMIGLPFFGFACGGSLNVLRGNWKS